MQDPGCMGVVGGAARFLTFLNPWFHWLTIHIVDVLDTFESSPAAC